MLQRPLFFQTCLALIFSSLVICGTALSQDDTASPETVEESGTPAEVTDAELVEDAAEAVDVVEEELREVFRSDDDGVEFVKGDVMIIPMEGEINAPNEAFLRRMLKEAERREASAFILDMDTYGGRIDSTMEMLKILSRSSIPTYTFINPNAASAGSIIAIGTKHIYMAPISALGAAAPVAGGEDLGETMREKTVSYFTALIRDTARENGHNPEIAEAFMNKDIQVKIGGEIISEKGSLLTLSAQEATREIDGEQLLAKAVVTDLPHLAQHAELTGQLIRFEKTGFEVLGHWLAIFAPILLLIGIAGGYLEFQAPGFGVPGIVSVIAFGLFFFGHQVVGLAGYELVAVFVIGIILIGIEIFVFPGLIVFAAMGLLMVLGAIFFTMVDTWPTGGIPEIGDLSALGRPLLNMGIALIGAVIFAIFAAIYLPKSALFNRFALSDSVGGLNPVPAAGSAADAALLSDDIDRPLTAGEIGEAVQDLRPVGKAAFREGHIICEVMSYGQWVSRGSRVRITRVSGSNIIVEPAPKDTPA